MIWAMLSQIRDPSSCILSNASPTTSVSGEGWHRSCRRGLVVRGREHFSARCPSPSMAAWQVPACHFRRGYPQPPRRPAQTTCCTYPDWRRGGFANPPQEKRPCPWLQLRGRGEGGGGRGGKEGGKNHCQGYSVSSVRWSGLEVSGCLFSHSPRHMSLTLNSSVAPQIHIICQGLRRGWVLH